MGFLLISIRNRLIIENKQGYSCIKKSLRLADPIGEGEDVVVHNRESPRGMRIRSRTRKGIGDGASRTEEVHGFGRG